MRPLRTTRLTIRLRLTVTYTLLITATGAAMLATVFAVLAIVPGYQFTNGPFPFGTTHDIYTINGRGDVLRLFLLVSLPTLVVIGGAGGLVSWFVAGRLLRPLHEIAATAERLDDRNLDARLDVSGPHDEIHEVVDTLNAMLDRLETAFTSRSRFAADASHELRTPLAAMKTMLQVAMRDPDGPDTPRTLARLHATVDQMTQITTSLLGLARGDTDVTARSIALREEVAAALRSVDDELRGQRIRVTVHLDDAVITGEPVLIRQLVANLVRNAVVHNVPGGTVDIVLVADPVPRLTVANDGPSVTPEEAATLTEPFRRLRRTHRDGGGSGLGLALVEQVATAHQAQLELSPRDTGGLIVTVTFGAPTTAVRTASGTPRGHEPGRRPSPRPRGVN